MVYILGWVVFGFLLAVMVALSVGAVWFSEEPSSKEAKEAKEAKVPEARALHEESKPHDVERKTAVLRAKTHH